MIIPKVKCVCGCEEVFFLEHPKSIGVLGIYCSACGRWIKWANKAEKRLHNLEVEREKRNIK